MMFECDPPDWAHYRIEAADRSLGYLLLCGAARAIEPRDRWIGWSARQRLSNLPWVVNNSRFLVFPWIQAAHLASHVLGRLARQLADDWQACWGYRPLLLESFVDPAHYRGTCYRAAGWQLLGHTSGRGLARPGKHYHSRAQADLRRTKSPIDLGRQAETYSPRCRWISYPFLTVYSLLRFRSVISSLAGSVASGEVTLQCATSIDSRWLTRGAYSLTKASQWEPMESE